MAAAWASSRTYPNATVSTAPDFATGRAERCGHGGTSVCGGEGDGDLDGGPGNNGAEEAAGGGEKKSLEVGLEGLDEIPVCGGGRVDVAGGVCVQQHGGILRLHGQGVAEEQRRGEGVRTSTRTRSTPLRAGRTAPCFRNVKEPWP